MARYINLLRAVNVGGTGKLRMAELSQTLETAGYKNVRTLLASGNVVLDTTKSSTTKLEKKFETLLLEAHGLSTDVMVRTPDEWTAIIKANPMPNEAETAPSAFGVMIMKGNPNVQTFNSFVETWKGPERIEIGKGCIYIHFSNGMGQSKLKLPKVIGIGTVRNWNTVRKLSDLASA